MATALAAAPGRRDLWRIAIIATGAAAILAPVALVVYQSFLSAPFFSARARFSLDGYEFVLADEDFWAAGLNSVVLAASMVAIAVPVGAALAYLVVRTDLPARRALETLVLVPLFVSPMVLAFGYVVSLGPVGFLTTAYESVLGAAPWNIYSMLATALIVALTHVPHVYLYVAAALRLVPSDSEEAARVAGAGPGRTALTVTLPMVLPSIGVGA
ncbi:MAG: ABC transporter permease, partial [Microvirga sp.]